MRTQSLKFASLMLAAAIGSSAVGTGCAARASYRYYDHDHDDYHAWDNNEVVFYAQWETDTHRKHRDFHKRNDDEKNEYWKWRHDHDHDHDCH